MEDFAELAESSNDESSGRIPMFDFESRSRVGKAMAYWSAGEMLWRSGQKIYNYWNAHRQLTVTISSKDTIYLPVLEWLASDEFGSSAKEVALVSNTVYDPTSESMRPTELKVVQNTSQVQTIRLGGYKLKVCLQDSGSGSTSNKLGIEKPSTSRLIFTTYNQDAHSLLLDKLFAMYDEQRSAAHPPKLWAPGPWGGFRAADSLALRSLESVILKDGELDYLINDIDTFLESEDRYNKLGIPWHRGYLFYGVAGTGKTSIAKAIAGHFGLDVYYIPLGDLKDDGALNSLLCEIRPRSVLLLEDIDVFNAATSRKAEKNELSLSGLLNALDGIATPHGMITVMTTNVAEDLDSALVRSGRIDVRQEFTLLDDDQGQRLYKHFYNEDLPDNYSFAGKSPADIVGVFKQNLDNPKAALKALKRTRKKVA